MGFWDYISVAAQSVGTTVTMALGGVILRRRGIVDDVSTKVLAKSFVKLFLPCLLFTRVAISTSSAAEFSRGLFMTAANVVIAGIGLVLGELLLLVCRPPSNFVNTFRVAIWNNNGTSLPIVLVAAIAAFAPQFKDPDDNLSSQKAQDRAIGFVAFYALSYQTLAWTVGYHMLRPPKSLVQPKDEHQKQTIHGDTGPKQCLGELETGYLPPTAIADATTPSKPEKLSYSWLRSPCSSIMECIERSFVWQKILVPPVIGVIAGVLVGMVPPFRKVLCPDGCVGVVCVFIFY